MNFLAFMEPFEPNYLNLEYFFNLVYGWLVSAGVPVFPESWLFWIKVVLAIITLGLLILVVYLVVRLVVMQREHLREAYQVVMENVEDKQVRNAAWLEVLKNMDSENESNWKLAIIEADKMLDTMVKAMNYPGENLGERLKGIEPSDFLTLENAWEAHRIRNRIAHESGFMLSRRDARRAISLYESVFKEFNYI